MSYTRAASHAGSWYSASRPKLDSDLDSWLGAVQPNTDIAQSELPLPQAKAVIAPHAGYSYSGPTAAYAYKAIDPAKYKRVFILGPSHHYHLSGCALSGATAYQTPLGPLPLDFDAISKLRSTGQFEEMTPDEDEDEHSIEMHLPYVRKVFQDHEIKIVPILVGSLSHAKETSYGSLLAPYFLDPQTFFVVSSDFCHWGLRFRYTYYTPSLSLPLSPTSLAASSSTSSSTPIHASIAHLDRSGMSAISFPSSPSDTLFSSHSLPPLSSFVDQTRAAIKDASEAHRQFTSYLRETKNTVCGRHPIGVLLGVLEEVKKRGKDEVKVEWTRYEQSEKVREVRGSSVSYASAVVTVEG